MKNQVISELLCVLEIDKDISNVSIRDINVAFRRLALIVHPDKAEGGDISEKTAAFQKLRSAYERLKKYLEENVQTKAADLQTNDEEEEDIFFKDNFDKFNFSSENKGSFTIAIEDHLANNWQELLLNLLGEPKVVINDQGTDCDRHWKVNYVEIVLTLHI